MNMVEKMARAMARANYPGFSERDIDEIWEGWAMEAEACLTALSEPSEEMIAAALETNSRFGKSAMANIWQAMLAAASKD